MEYDPFVLSSKHFIHHANGFAVHAAAKRPGGTAMDPETQAWFKAQMDQYNVVHATYEALSKTLTEILAQICSKVAPGARTEGRAKSEFSFAEKILIRKKAKYKGKPFDHIRDLAGARAIVYTLDQVEAVCRAIEAENSLEKGEGGGLRIEWKNCVNEKRELGTDQFRYAGIHYIVELTGNPVWGVMPESFVCQAGDNHLFAEIQVCTYLQHVWSAISHDRVYKPQLTPPQTLVREINAVSALLESADNAFARAIHELDQFRDELNAKLPADVLEQQIELWKGVVAIKSKNHGAAYELGRRYLAAEQWIDAFEILGEIRNAPGAEKSASPDQLENNHRVRLDLAQAALRSNHVEIGQKILGEIIAADSENIQALALLGTSWLEGIRLDRAGEYLTRAFNLRPDEPAVLSAYLEYLLRSRTNTLPKDMQILQGTLKAAVDKCQKCADREVRVPQVHFARGRFYALMGDAYQAMARLDGDQPNYIYASLDAYCRGIVASRTCTPIADELAALERIIGDRRADGSTADDEAHHAQLCGNADWECLELGRMLLRTALVAKACQQISIRQRDADEAERLAREAEAKAEANAGDKMIDKSAVEEALVHAKSLRENSDRLQKDLGKLKNDLRDDLETNRSRLMPLRTHADDKKDAPPDSWPMPVVIVAGGCDAEYGPKLVARYQSTFNKAFEYFAGTLIGGGTTAGVSGMVANLSGAKTQITKIGYMPPNQDVPHSDTQAPQYVIRRTFGRPRDLSNNQQEPYSPAGPIQMWADLLSLRDFNPSKVRLLGIDGGKISGFEFRLALAMGATVGVVKDSQRAVKTLLEDKGWKLPEGVAELPTDPATWAAFVNNSSPILDELPTDAVETAAAFVHEAYRNSPRTQANPDKHHASVLPWDKELKAEYKQSSRHQVRYAKLNLQEAGYAIQPAVEPFDPKSPPVPRDYEQAVEAMARREHGRFCAERLSLGWHLGPVNDPKNKINDTLVPWSELTEATKDYDRAAVRNYPRWLAQAHLIIVKRDPQHESA